LLGTKKFNGGASLDSGIATLLNLLSGADAMEREGVDDNIKQRPMGESHAAEIGGGATVANRRKGLRRSPGFNE
jgi:hypothetical protein